MLLSAGILFLGNLYESVTWRGSPNGTIAIVECFLFTIFAIAALLWARAVQRERLRFEMLLAQLSADFTTACSDEAEAKIQKWLQILVSFFGVDRGAFLQLTSDGKALHRTFSTSAPGIESMPAYLQKDILPWFITQIEKGTIVNLPNASKGLPSEAIGEQEYTQQTGLKSLVAVPVVISQQGTFALTLSTLKSHRKWPESLFVRLRVVVVVFANALERMRAKAEEMRLNALVAGERRRLGEIVANVPGVVWEAWGRPDSAKQQIDFISDQVETLLGYRKEEWLSKPDFWLTVVHPADQAKAAQENAEIFASGKGGVQQFRWVAKSGRVLWMESHIAVVCDESGKAIGMRGITLDVTQSKEAEEAWVESERLNQSIADTMPSVLYLYDLVEQRNVYSNSQIMDLLGYTKDEIWLMGSNFRKNLMHPDDFARLPEHLRHFENMEGRSVLSLEYRMRHRNGNWRWIAGYETLYSRTDEGHPKLILGIAQDITARRLSEIALRESEELNRTVLDSLQSLIVILDGTGRILASNQQWRNWGPLAEEPDARIDTGSNYFETCEKSVIADDEKAAEALCGIRAVLAREKTQFRIEYECPQEDGALWFELLAFALRREEGGAVITHTDITWRKQAEEALQKSNAQIRELAGRIITAQEEERRRIARDLHDDLSQRLAVHTIDLSNIRREFASTDERLGQRLMALQEHAAELGDVTRLISHELHSPLVEYIGPIAALQTLCREFARLEDIMVEADLPEDIGQLSPEAALCLYRVTQETLRNVAKHAQASAVEVKLRRARREVILMIEDNGVGFDPEDPSLHSGLGLLSLRERVHLLRGTFSVTSNVGTGTRVTVHLPTEEVTEGAHHVSS
ncbi:PAS domain-containing protein [Verrucomicrobiota bacterium sgz303538]